MPLSPPVGAVSAVSTWLLDRWRLLQAATTGVPSGGEDDLGYLVAVLCVWLARIVAGFLLAPGGGRAARFRIVPMSDPAAKFWQRRIIVAVGVLAFSGRVAR